MPDLPVGAAGFKPGHPQIDRPTLATTDVADRLGTSGTTVGSLVRSGELDGYWHRPPGRKRYHYFAYADAVERFVVQYGRFDDPGRARRRGPTGSVRSLASELTEMRSALRSLRLDVDALQSGSRQPVDAGTAVAQVNKERARRVELEEALAAIERADELLEESLLARDESMSKLRQAYGVLRLHATSSRLPRTADDLG